jgi:hypothetical protein
MLLQWCTTVMRSKVEPMKAVAAMVRKHLDFLIVRTRSRQNNG